MLRFAALALAVTLGIGSPAPQGGDPHRPAILFDRDPPSVPDRLRHGVLIFSKTNGFRHVEMIPHANAVLAEIAQAEGRRTFTTENAAIFNASQLRQFDVIVLNSASGDLFTPAQRQALVDFVKTGGGIVALHGAVADANQPWTFYVDDMIGARFIGHPGGTDQLQAATINVIQPGHPVMAGLPQSWSATDEWYSFDRVPGGAGTTILASLDERSYRLPRPLAMGALHPIIWTRTLGRGRIVVSALGHRAEAYDDAVDRRLISNAIRWASRHSAQAPDQTGGRFSANAAVPSTASRDASMAFIAG